MARTLHSSTLAEIDNESVSMCHLVSFGFSTTVYMTDAAIDIDDGTNTYTSSSDLIELDTVTESSDVRVGTITVTLSGVSQSFISTFLSGGYMNRQVLIYRAFLDASSDIIGLPILIYDGRIDGYDISETQKESTVTVSVASHWSDFERKSGRYTNPNSQALYFRGDLGFDFAAASVKDIKWGRA